MKLNLRASRNRKSQAGMTMVETMVALAILVIVATGVMGIAVLAVTTTENQGHLAARTTEYAQDKMEQLLALAFCDGPSPVGTDTTVFPAAVSGGTGLGGCNNAMTPPTPLTGGSLSTTAPAAGYVDYLDASGNLVASSANWQYTRVWQISVPPGSVGLKQISVKAKVRSSVGSNGALAESTVAELKAYPF